MAKKINLSNFTRVLLHFDDESNPYKDECGNTWTIYTGNPVLTSANKKFGTHCLSSGGISTNCNIDLASTIVSVECFFYPEPQSDITNISFNSQTNTLAFCITLCNSIGNLVVLDWDTNNGNTWNVQSSVKPSVGQWNHFAVVINKNSISLFLNGTKTGTGTFNNITKFTSIMINATFLLIDEFRISDGIARWTENFTPPTSPYSFDSKNLVNLYEIKPTPPAIALASGIDTIFAQIIAENNSLASNLRIFHNGEDKAIASKKPSCNLSSFYPSSITLDNSNLSYSPLIGGNMKVMAAVCPLRIWQLLFHNCDFIF